MARRGGTYRAMGRHDEALADFTRAVDLDPADGWNHYRLFLLHLARGDTGDAQQHLHRALSTDRANIESSPFDTRVWFNIAVYLAALGEEDEAEAQIRAALDRRASRAAVLDVIDDLEGLHRATGRISPNSWPSLPIPLGTDGAPRTS